MLTIGSDPEFGLARNGRQVVAYEYVSNGTTAPIGTDGHSDIGELRPKYAASPRQHAVHISELIQELENIVPANINVTAGSMAGDDPIGGHIHFGGFGRGYNRDILLRSLDYLLSVPVAMIEKKASARKRRSGEYSYGKLGAYRTQNWGIEYRTLPSWLVSWGVALSVLSVGYAIADAVDKKEYPNIPKNIPDPYTFDTCDKEKLQEHLDDIRKEWRNLPLYPKLRLEFAFLNHMLIRGFEWREGEDIRERWPIRPIPTRNPNGVKIVANNNDMNCAQIAELIDVEPEIPVYIYGLNQSRENAGIYTSHNMSNYSGDLRLEVGRAGRANSRRYDGFFCIGLPYGLRMNVNAAAASVNAVLRAARGQFVFTGASPEPTIRWDRNVMRYRDSNGRFASNRSVRSPGMATIRPISSVTLETSGTEEDLSGFYDEDEDGNRLPF